MTTESDSPKMVVVNEPNIDKQRDLGYGLLRMILIDSLSPGRVIEMPVESGAVLTGRNGRGKTSMLQLLLLFYGESPNRIVTVEAGRESFIGYYLPRDTSYIIFEYHRRGNKCQVAVYADRNGDKVVYRFIRHGFELLQFALADGEIVRAKNLVKHLKIQGFQCCEQQIESLSEYRAIVQAVPSGTRDRQRQRYLRELTADYSFTPTHRPLPQIEKIVGGMFRRKTNFEDLQGMVVECVSDQTNILSISGDRRKIEDWPCHYKAYREVMALAPTMDAVEQTNNSLLAVELALGEIKAKYLSLLGNLDQSSHKSMAEQRKQTALLAEETDAYNAKHNELAGLQLSAKREAEFSGEKAAKLKDQYDGYEHQELPKKEALVSRSPQLHDELAILEERRKILLGEQSEISSRYERLKQTEKDNFNAFRDTAQVNLRQIADACDGDLRQMEAAFNEDEHQSGVANDAMRVELERAVHQASTEHGRWLQSVSQPAPDSQITDALQKKQEALDALHYEKERSEVQRRTLETVYQKAKQSFHDQEEQKAVAMRWAEGAEKELANVRRLHSPEEGTLLHFLRNEHPPWIFDIAKVVREDILVRDDLSPGLVEQGGALYGLSLDLEKLNAHPLADQQAAQQEIDRAETRLQEAKGAIEKAHAALLAAAQARTMAEQACQSHQQPLFQVTAKIKAAQADVESAKRQVESSKRDGVEQALRRLEQAKQDLTTAQTQLLQFDTGLKAQNAEKRIEFNQKRQDRLAKRDSERKAVDVGVAEWEAALERKIRQYDIERDTVLRQKGVDPDQLKNIDNELTRISKDLATIKSVNELVQQWKHWTKHEWPSYDQFLLVEKKHRELEMRHGKAIEELAAQWKQRRQQLQGDIKRLDNMLYDFNEQRQLAQRRLEKMHGYPEVAVPVYDPTWTLDSLVGLANQYEQEYKRLQVEVRRFVLELHRGFGLHPGTPPDQFLQSYRSALATTDEREWIAPFKKWFAEGHSEYQRILLTEAVTIAGDVQAFHRTMEDFHRRVQQFNRELQVYLDTNLAFDSISKVSVEVVSTIKELKYWPAICEMTEAHRSWLGGASSELPPIEFAQTIERLLDHWEVKSGIRADLKHLIRIQGEVIENGNRRVFRKASDLEAVSSNGLSYLVLVSIFVAFINRIRRDADVNIVWSLDELKDLDSGNVIKLLELLDRNNITLVSAFPDPDPDTLALFKHRFTVEADRRLAEVRIMDDESCSLVEDVNV